MTALNDAAANLFEDVATRPTDETAVDTLSRHAAELELSGLPATVVAMARIVLADTIGVLLAGSRGRAVDLALEVMPGNDPAGSTVVGRARRLPAPMAAFANGICAHDLELDDSHSPSRTHAASVVVPAALAAAELGADVTGDDLLSGIIAGYDVQVRLSKAMGVQQQFDRGFHPTAVCGAVGAAVAASRVLRLPPVALRSSIALAASQSSGLLTFEEDTSHMVKSFQTGIAARNGVTAAAFARQGFVGSPDVLTGRHNLLTPFGGPAPQLAQLLDGLGSRYDITQTSIKRHACCGQTHSAVDGTLTLLSEHGLQWQDIDAIEAEVSHGAIDIVDGNPLWTHNIQYVLALAAHEGAIRPEHFSESWTTHPEIHALAEKVRVRGNDVLQSRFPAQKGAIVTIRTSDGEFSITSPMPVGSPGVPLPEAAVRSKFDGMAGAVLETAEVSELWDLMMGLDQNSTLGDLFARVSGVRP